MDKQLNQYDLKLIHQVDDNWYLLRGRLYSTLSYHGKRDRIYYKNGRLWRDTWVHQEADPLQQVMQFSKSDPKILPAKLKCMRYDCKDIKEMLEDADPSLLKLPWVEE